MDEETKELLTIEEHARNEKTPDYVLAALKVRYRYAAGKAMTREEYVAAVDRLLHAPMKGE